MRRLRFIRQNPLNRNDVLCMVAILALATLFLFPALRPGYTLLPLGIEGGTAPWHKQVTQQAQNLLLSDPFYTFYPRRNFFTQALQSGTYPLWNPYIFSGHPVAADTAAQTFYPPNLVVALLIPAARALPILAWFHLIITGISMYGLMRLLGLNSGPSLFGAVAWMLNGDAIVWLENPHRLSTLAWLPAVFLFYELALRRRRTWPGVIAGLFYGLSILGGHVQFALGIGLALGFYALFRTLVLSRLHGRLDWRPLIMLVTVALLGVGIGALQLLPTLQLARMSHRETMDVSQLLATRWPVEHAIGLWMPDFFGNPVRFPYWGRLNFAEVTAYFGALAFPLALASLFWVRRADGRFFVIAFVLTVLVAWGTPLVWLVGWVPGFSYFRLVSLTAFVPFFGAIAAGFGLQEWLARARQSKPLFWGVLGLILVTMVLVAALITQTNYSDILERWTDVRLTLLRTILIWAFGVGLLLYAHRQPAIATALLVLLLAVDLFQWGQPFNPVNSLNILYPENDVTAWLRQDPSLYRVLPLQTDRPVFGPNVLSVFEFYEIGGYSSLMVEQYRELVKTIDDQVSIWWMRPNQNMLVNSHFDPLFSLLNVKYVLTSHQLEGPLFSADVSYLGCADPAALVTTAEPFVFTFEAQNPGLNRLDVGLLRVGNTDGQSLRLRVWRDGQDGDLIADTTIDGPALPEQGDQVLFFSPVADSAHQTFVWSLEMLQNEGDASVAVCQADDEPPGWPAFSAYSVQLQHVDIQQGVWIYENPNVLPRAYVVHRAQVVPRELMLEQMDDPDLNLWNTVLLETPLPNDQMAQLADGQRSGSVAHITDYDLHRVDISVAMTAPGILVLSDQWFPGWNVTVDGVPAPLIRANYALRGVFLPQGEHQVIFRYEPYPVRLGAVLSGVTLLCGIVLIAWDAKRHCPQTGA